jgi:3-dehydroquinate synthetase
MRRVTIGVDPPYDIEVGDGALARVADQLPGRRRVAVVSHPAVADAHGARVKDPRRGARVDVITTMIGAREPAKSHATV